MISSQNIQQADYFNDLPIEVHFEPFVRVGELGKRGMPARLTIQKGAIGYANYNWDPKDHDSLDNVYLVGETISKNPFQWTGQCFAAVLSERPGRFELFLTTPLPGISETENDLAAALFMYRLAMRHPGEFLEQQSKWFTPAGQQQLKDDVRNKILRGVQTTILDPAIQIWSSPRASSVGDEIFKSINLILETWGLAVMSDFIALRRFPPALDNIVLQFQSAEIGLLEMPERKRVLLMEKLDLSATDLGNLKLESERYGNGAGIYRYAQKNISPFAEWLRSERALDAADLLEKLYSGKFKDKAVTLTENVIRSRFRHPMLGLGEWGGADVNLDRMSASQLGDYMRSYTDQIWAMTDSV